MDLTALHTELQAARYDGLSDADALALLLTPDQAVTNPVEKSRLVIWCVTRGIRSKLDAFASSTIPIGASTLGDIVRGAIETLTNANITALHLNDPYVDMMLDILVQTQVLSAADITALVALATTTVSRATQLGYGVLTEGDVQRARGGQW